MIRHGSKILATLNRGLSGAEEGLMAALLVGMTMLTFSQVVARYALNAGWVWSLEATTTMFGALVMVGISYGVREHAHLHVDALVRILPRPARRAAAFGAIGLCFIYLGLMMAGSLQLVEHLHAMGTTARDLPLKRWVIMSMLPVGFLLCGVRLAQVSVDVLSGRRDTLGQAHELPGGTPAHPTEQTSGGV